MGQAINNERSTLTLFMDALEANNKNDIKKIASTEILNDGSMLNAAIRRGSLEQVKFLIEECSIMSVNL